LGIEINYTKSKLYDSQKEMLPIFEFAKRTCVGNHEISGIPYDFLKVSTESIYNYVDLVLYLKDTKLLVISGNLAFPKYLSDKGRYYLEILC